MFLVFIGDYFDSIPTVSLIVACMVAYIRKARYKRFKKRRMAVRGTEEPASGIMGRRHRSL
jgi:hypothetical protein